jgi:ribosomal-protein-alanine N-acetyltransferase
MFVSLPLKTERLVIREFTLADLDGVADLFADPAVLWWEPAPYSRTQSQEWLEHTLQRYREEGMAELAVVLASDGRIVGDCGPVWRQVEGRRLPELGWDLRRDEWGKGYATEAARGVLTHVADLGLRRVYSLITPDNLRSQAVARRLDMQVERRIVWEDSPHDLWALDLA